MNYKISIVIRTYNEQKHLPEVLESIKNQTYKNYEIILVDSESTDKTVEIAKKYGVKIVPILKKDFNYSYASNVGVKNSSGDIVCFLSGHSVPAKNNYLEETNKIFQDEKIGGCYGDVIALKDGSIWEKLYNKLGYIKNVLLGKKDKVKLETEIHPGILSCSNASIRKSVFDKHLFVDELGKKGGEDVELAYRIIQDGFYVAQVPNLLVKHSHGSKLKKFLKELKNWKVMYQEVLTYISGENNYVKN